MLFDVSRVSVGLVIWRKGVCVCVSQHRPKIPFASQVGLSCQGHVADEADGLGLLHVSMIVCDCPR